MSTPDEELETSPQGERADRPPSEQPARRGGRRGCFLTGCGTVLALLLLLLGAGIYLGSRSESLTENVPATIQIASGSAEIRRAGGNWERAGDMSALLPGDAIRITDGSVVLVNYFDGSTTRLTDRSEFVMLKSSRSVSRPGLLSPLLARLTGGGTPEPQIDTDISGRLMIGKSLTRVQKLTSSNSHFEFQAPNSVAGVTGTIFELVVDQNGQSAWRVAEGSVQTMAIVVDDATGQVTGVLMPLVEGDRIVVPPLPPGVTADLSAIEKLLNDAQRIVNQVVDQVRREVEAALGGATAVGGTPVAALVADKLKEMNLFIGVTQDETGKDKAMFNLRAGQITGKSIQEIATQAAAAVLKSVVDTSDISRDWLDDWRGPGREIVILTRAQMENQAARAAERYGFGQFTIVLHPGLVSATVAPYGQATVLYSLVGDGWIRVVGVPGWVQPDQYRGMVSSFVRDIRAEGDGSLMMKPVARILKIVLERQGQIGHGPGGVLLPAPLASDQLVVVMER